ncbi:hypothetical protein PR003_g17620 [Phytophthora rubi]|uniref:Uncharacterized protein n=1 Tax=Phytophthora rubi TaxID=129364 RepID=A0A6A3KDY6_9STRA|nr:hypothetical protein PR001_g18591 [Phytophthora rubi]KAE9005616.1 hypothetical protein PR002_g16714 [Phytophthora rubi]KAE9320807.1 hypothetical protein PR003_g17620 [Phytophthora rubi]
MEDEEKKAATPTHSDQQTLAPQLSTAVFEALRQTSTVRLVLETGLGPGICCTEQLRPA